MNQSQAMLLNKTWSGNQTNKIKTQTNPQTRKTTNNLGIEQAFVF